MNASVRWISDTMISRNTSLQACDDLLFVERMSLETPSTKRSADPR